MIPGIGFRRRMLTIFIFAAGFFFFLSGRLAWIQFVRGEWLRAQAMEVRLRDIPVEAKRGLITDRNLRELAVSMNADSVFAMPAQVKNPPEEARLLSDILKVDYDRVLTRLTRPSSFVYIKRKISPEESRALRELLKEKKLPGIDLTQEGKRVYTKERLGAHLIGIAGIDSQGLEGLEKQYDEQLKGSPGRIQIEADARGKAIEGAAHQYIPPRDGSTLVTTIDENIQYIAQRGVDRAMLETKCKRAGIIVLDVKTGGILAMAMAPDFDPNKFGDFPDSNRRNWMIADTLEPGSMFKPLVAAAALEEGLITKDTPFNAPAALKMSGYTINNWNHKPVVGTLQDVVEQSSNTGFVQIGLRLGIPKFYQYLRAFGMTEETGLDLPGEAKGISPAEARTTQLDLATMSFGQTLTVTPLQMVVAMAAIANDGYLMKPHLASEIRSPEGLPVWKQETRPVRQVISRQVARGLGTLMERVISQGTGRNAYVPGYQVAGKTGTAEKLPRGSGKYIADFVGFGPVKDPRLAVVIIVDEPQGVYYGGQIAAPIFGEIMGDLLRYLEIPPELSAASKPGQPPVPLEETVAVPSLVNLTPADAEREAKAAGFRLKIEGGGVLVTVQTPPPGAMLRKGSLIAAEAGNAIPGKGSVTVPGLKGKNIKEAGNLLGLLNLGIKVVGSGVAVSQQPAPGTKVETGTVITVEFSPPP